MNNFIHMLFRYKWEDTVLDAVNHNDPKCFKRSYRAFCWMIKIAREGGFLLPKLIVVKCYLSLLNMPLS